MDYPLRRCQTARPDLQGCGKSRSRTETHWDPFDPVVQARALKLDGKHWSQIRTEATSSHRGAQNASSSSDLKPCSDDRNGLVKIYQSDDKAAAERNKDCLAPKTAYTKLSPLPWSRSWLAKLDTGYNQRARQGFVYWYTPRPKPTLYGKYSLGAKHMQYGLCMAPRS